MTADSGRTNESSSSTGTRPSGGFSSIDEGRPLVEVDRPPARARCPSRPARCVRGRSRGSGRRRRSSARLHPSSCLRRSAEYDPRDAVPLLLRPPAGSRRQRDGRDEPAARHPRRSARARAWRQRRRRGPRRRRRALRRPSRCRPGSAATASRSSGGTARSRASTPPGRRPPARRAPRARGRARAAVGDRPGMPSAGWAALAERHGRLGLDALSRRRDRRRRAGLRGRLR